jgi:two-component system, chemotaxis family, protein-glutamate methylesterase/glutaminase
MYDLVCMGASWGGLKAVGQVLSDLPEDFDLPIAIAQHRHRDSQAETLAKLLQAKTNRPVLDVDDKMPIASRHVYIAPPNYHLLVERGSFALSVDEHIQYARPSIDVLFETAAHAYGAGVIGIILTGANADGALGLARIKDAGGVALIQEPRDAARRTMPDAAIAATAADAVLQVEEIANFLYGLWVNPVVNAVTEAR